MKKVLLVIFALLVLSGAFWVYQDYRNNQENTAQVDSLRTVEIERGSLINSIGTTGWIRANQSSSLLWQTSGIVEDVHIQCGDRIQKGGLLATLALSSLPNNLILARANLVNAQNALDDLYKAHSNLEIAKAEQAVIEAAINVDAAERYLYNLTLSPSQYDIDQANANLILAQEKLKRTQEEVDRIDELSNKGQKQYEFWESRKMYKDILKLLKLQLVADQKRFDSAQQKFYDLTEPVDPDDVSLAELTLELAKAELVDATGEVDRLAKGPSLDDLSAAESRIAAYQATINLRFIFAPFSGTVTAVYPKPGDLVQSGTTAFWLDDLDRLFVDVDLSEVDINLVQIGQEVELVFDAVLNRKYHGEVVEVAIVGQSQDGVVDFPVIIDILDPDADIRPGMTAAVTIFLSKLEDVLIVPNRALRVDKGSTTVFVLRDDGVITPIIVSIGVTTDFYSQIVDGDLKEGDQVILNPAFVLGGSN
jgi:HlyD family secretion protein